MGILTKLRASVISVNSIVQMSYPGGDMKEFPAGAVFTVRERITQAKLHVVKLACHTKYTT